MLFSKRPERAPKAVLAMILAAVLLGLSLLPAVAQEDSPKTDNDVIQALGSDGEVRVIVSFLPAPGEMQAQSSEASIAGARSEVLEDVPDEDIAVYRTYSHIPAFAAEVDADGIAALQADPRVAYIQLDEPVFAHLTQSVTALGANIVHDTYGLTGSGVRVAVLDTGIDTDHPDLVGDIVAQHCFNSTGTRCPNGLFEDVSAEDGNGHGTNVSGVITADGVVSGRGFAPDAEIVAIRVLNSTGSGMLSDTVAGLNWIIAYQNTLRVDIINMSLGSNTLYTGVCDAQNQAMTSAITQLRNLGIAIFASSGNNGSNNSMVAPACITGVVSVGATFDSNLGAITFPSFGNCSNPTTSLQTVTCFTNSNSLLDIVAPGSRITSAGRGGGTSTYNGTSQASPTAAGVAALILQARSNFTPDQIEITLKTTGTLVTDSKNGLSFRLINALAAIQSLIPQAPTIFNPSTTLVSDRQPTFTWNAVPLATYYEMRFDTVSPPVTIVVSGNVTSYQPPAWLDFGTYYWQVRAGNDLGVSDWSPVRTTIIGSQPNAAPSAYNYVENSTPTLRWNRLSWATEYQVEVDNSSKFNALPLEFSAILPWETLEATVTPALGEGVYYWRVRGRRADGTWGGWSPVQTLIVGG
jgi:subtilisin family serine protease